MCKALKECLGLTPALTCLELQGLPLRERDLNTLIKVCGRDLNTLIKVWGRDLNTLIKVWGALLLAGCCGALKLT